MPLRFRQRARPYALRSRAISRIPEPVANVSTSDISPSMSKRISGWSQARLMPSMASLTAEQRGAGFQKFLRIDRFAVDAGLVMQMRAGRAPGRADPADHLADANALADANVDLGEMAVAGGEAIAVVDLDHLAIAAAPAGRRHCSRSRSMGRLAIGAAEIDAGVH